VPDFVFGIRDRNRKTGRNERYYFVEIDRGTMPVSRKDITQTSFIRKVLSYADTLDAKLAQKRFGIAGFQVLTVTHSQRRIIAICDTISELQNNKVTANTFLFKVDRNKQSHLHFHTDWHNIRGNPINLFT